MRNSSEKVIDQLEKSAGVADMEAETDTLQNSWLRKQMAQSPRANVEPTLVLAGQKL